MKVLCVGHCTYDLTCEAENLPVENSKDHYQVTNSCGGGSASNGACLLGKYNIETYMASVVGDDTYGNLILKELERFNVNTKFIETAYESPSDIALIFKNPKNGSRTIFGVSKTPMAKKKTDYDFDPDYILADSYDFNSTLNAFNKFPNAVKIIDADNYDNVTIEMCKRSTYIIASEKFAINATKTEIDKKNPQSMVNMFSKLISIFPKKSIIVTLGEGGALFLKDNQIKIIPALNLTAVDTTGAGDIFRAGFTYGLINNFDIEKAITFGVIAAGLSIQKEGGRTSIPELAEVTNELNKKYSNQEQNTPAVSSPTQATQPPVQEPTSTVVPENSANVQPQENTQPVNEPAVTGQPQGETHDNNNQNPQT